MNIFFDCEFTGLNKNTTLISLGLISEDNKTFYAEFTDYNKNQVDEWIEKNVISYLRLPHDKNKDEDNYYSMTRTKDNPKENSIIDGFNLEIVGSKQEIANMLKKWLSQFDSVQLISDVCHYDMVLFIDLFGSAFDIPNNVSPSCHDLNADIAKYQNVNEKEAFDISRKELAKKFSNNVDTLDNHNSLDDAKMIKYIYEGIKNHIENDEKINSSKNNILSFKDIKNEIYHGIKKNYKYFVMLIYDKKLNKNEFVINSLDNMIYAKLAYYEKNYNENLILKADENISIKNFALGNDLAEIMSMLSSKK